MTEAGGGGFDYPCAYTFALYCSRIENASQVPRSGTKGYGFGFRGNRGPIPTACFPSRVVSG
jgi:hypothetical protein